jgi:hypothetical protein
VCPHSALPVVGEAWNEGVRAARSPGAETAGAVLADRPPVRQNVGYSRRIMGNAPT